MKRIHLLAPLMILFLLAGTLLPAGPVAVRTTEATAHHTITIDGDLSDWDPDEYMENDSGLDLYLTWDAANIYLGLSDAYLGDTVGQDMSFFVCFDTDLTAGSGAPSDGYARVLFNPDYYAPEYCYYFAGGAGWYEWSIWNGASWDWPGWRSDGTFFNYPGNPAPAPGSELTILRSDIGDPAAVGVVAWLTAESDTTVLASWPTPNGIGIDPTLVHFYHLPYLGDGYAPNRAVLADHVVINELDNYTEWIELYNPTAAAVDISGWQLTADHDSLNYTIPGGTVLPAGAYWTYTTTTDLSNGGDVISLYDTGPTLVDQVAYGNYGGAPAPFFDIRTAARVPNGTDTDDHAWDWNLTQDPTFGAANNVPAVMLGSSLIINEINNYSPGDDAMELYNPLGSDVALNNWWIADGDGYGILITGTVIPAGGWWSFDPNALGVYISSSDVAYLFMPDGVRVDQIGFDGEYENDTFQRICDGEGPNDGYDWASSGGDAMWYDLPATLGGSNCAPLEIDALVDKTGPAGAAAGEQITYTLLYDMGTPRRCDALAITDTLPAAVTFITYTSVPPVTWNGSPTAPAFDAGTVYGWTGGQIELVVQISDTLPLGYEIVNQVEVYCMGDFTPSNDIDTFTTTIVGVDILIDKAGPADPLWPDDTAVYTLSYDLIGTDPALDVVVTDLFPTDWAYVDHWAPGFSCTPSASDLVCTAASIDTPGQIVLTGTVATTPTAYVLTNTATITASNDADDTNNEAQEINQLVMPVSEIQYVPDPSSDDASPYVGQHVWSSGVVVAASDVYGTANTRYFIEDPAGGAWSGLYIYNGGDKPAVQEGDLVLLYGQVEEYNGVTELNIRDSVGGIQTILANGHPLPAPELLSTATFTTTNPNGAEPYESVLIEFQAATVISDNLGFGEWLFDDGSGGARADDWSNLLTYQPAMGDLYGYIRGIGNYSYGDYKLVPRYDADVNLAYPVTLMYHDLEDVVQNGEAIYVAGDFNGWDPLATALNPDGGYDVFSVTVTVDVTGTHEYKYVVYTDTVPTGPANWNWLQTNNRSVEVGGGGETAHDYRFIEFGYVVLQWPPTTTTTIGVPTENIYGQIWADDLTARPGAPRAVQAEVGYGADPDPATWSAWEAMAWGNQAGDNDEFIGTMTPLQTGVFSYVVRFNANWGAGNPNDMWAYGDLDGVYPGDPFEMANAGILTVVGADLGPSDKVADRDLVQPGDLLSYTISLSNVGDIDAMVAITDIVPTEVEVVTGTLPPDMVYVGGQLLWNGVVTQGAQVDLTFYAFANTGLVDGHVFTNVVWIDDGQIPPFQRTAVITVETECVAPYSVDFTWSPLQPFINLPTTFTGSAEGSEPISYAWDFGDGSTDSGLIVTHIYTTPYTYTVTLTATNACGSETAVHDIVVQSPGYDIFLPIVFKSAP